MKTRMKYCIALIIDFYPFILFMKKLMTTKNSVTKIQNLLVNHESRLFKLNPE